MADLTDADGVPYNLPPGVVHATERPDLLKSGPCWYATRIPGVAYDWCIGEIVGPSDIPGRWIIKGAQAHRALTHLAFDVED